MNLKPTQNNPLRFGVLCNAEVLEQWQADAIQLLIDDGNRIELVVLNSEQAPKQSWISKIRHYPYSKIVFRLWHRFFFRPKAKTLVNVSALFANTERLHCKTTLKGSSNYFYDKDVQFIKRLQLDFLLRFGFNIVRGDILNAALYGVWSFHHGDEIKFRGGPPGFWEVYKNCDVNGIILQQLTSTLDKGFVLKKMWLPVIKHSYKAHLDQLYNESRRMPVQLCQSIRNGCLTDELSQSKAPIFYPPGNGQMIWFLFLLVFRRIHYHLKHLFRQEDWNIAIVNVSLDTFLADVTGNLQRAVWLPKKKKSLYLADPFVIKIGKETHLFAEQFDYSKGVGRLVTAKSTENFSIFRPVTDEAFHFSFPFLLEFEGEVYCVPECYESNGVQMYRFDAIKGKLVYERYLIEDVKAVDPVLFQHENLWWLMFTTKSLPSVHLYAYYAEHPFGPFVAHANNPIKSDIRSARNAGAPFYYKGMLVRPAQNCAGHYGKAVVLNQIIRLTISHFEEKSFLNIEPLKKQSFWRGLHSVNATTDCTVVDGKRYVFTWAGFVHQLCQKCWKR